MHRTNYSLLSLLALIAIVGLARPASADNAAEARALFDAAKASAKAGDCATAVPKFTKSYQLDPKPGTLRNLGYCEEQLGRIASAWRHFREVIQKFPQSDHVEYANERATALEPRVPKLTITLADGTPEGTKIKLDGEEVAPSDVGTPLAVDPGEHEIEVIAPGRDRATYDVELEEVETKTLDVEPGSNELTRAEAEGRGSSSIEQGTSNWRTIGMASAGGGAVLFGIGLLVLKPAAEAKSKSIDDDCGGTARTNCPPAAQDDYDTAKGLKTATYLAYGVGGAAVLAGLGLWLLAPPSSQNGRLRIEPTLGPSNAAIRVTGGW